MSTPRLEPGILVDRNAVMKLHNIPVYSDMGESLESCVRLCVGLWMCGMCVQCLGLYLEKTGRAACAFLKWAADPVEEPSPWKLKWKRCGHHTGFINHEKKIRTIGTWWIWSEWDYGKSGLMSCDWSDEWMGLNSHHVWKGTKCCFYDEML